MEKMFAVAGLSTLEGKVKVRFANEMARVKVLEKNGHTEVRLVALDTAVTKEAAVAVLLAHADFQDDAAQAVLKAYGVDEKPVKAPKAPKAPALTLDDMPKRDGKGHFLKREAREALLLAKLAELAPKKRAARTDEEKAKGLKKIKEVHQRLQAEQVAEQASEVALLDADDDTADLNFKDLGVDVPERDAVEA